MFLLPPAWTLETGLSSKAWIPELWDTPVLVIDGMLTDSVCSPWAKGTSISLRVLHCHAPIPGPTRVADLNRVRGARPYTRTLYLIFFFKDELVPVDMAHIL